MALPTFNRWRAKLISTVEPESVGTFEDVRVRSVAPGVALVCPFLRFDDEPCDQLIAYHVSLPASAARPVSRAAGACHRHLGHAFEVLAEAERVAVSDPCDRDALDATYTVSPVPPPATLEDTKVARRLIAAGVCASAEFGTTSVHEGYPVVSGARIELTPHAARSDAAAEMFRLIDDFDVRVTPGDDGSVALVTVANGRAEEWICTNRALREMVADLLDDDIDPTGYRYREVADAVPQRCGAPPRTYRAGAVGSGELLVRISPTPVERSWLENDEHARDVVRVRVDRVPRPGDYVELRFGRYRLVTVSVIDAGTKTYAAETVLDRVHSASNN